MFVSLKGIEKFLADTILSFQVFQKTYYTAANGSIKWPKNLCTGQTFPVNMCKRS